MKPVKGTYAHLSSAALDESVPAIHKRSTTRQSASLVRPWVPAARVPASQLTSTEFHMCMHAGIPKVCSVHALHQTLGWHIQTVLPVRTWRSIEADDVLLYAAIGKS